MLPVLAIMARAILLPMKARMSLPWCLAFANTEKEPLGKM